MPVGVGRLERDVERLIVIFDDVNIVGHEPRLELADKLRRGDAEAECGCDLEFVAVADGVICGTILFRDASRTNGSPWYDRPDIASFGQFAVEPGLQSRGLGRRLVEHAEGRAAASGARELALDTAEPATHLVDWYTRLGYRFIEYAQWQHTNYRSVILSKPLGGA